MYTEFLYEDFLLITIYQPSLNINRLDSCKGIINYRNLMGKQVRVNGLFHSKNKMYTRLWIKWMLCGSISAAKDVLILTDTHVTHVAEFHQNYMVTVVVFDHFQLIIFN